METKPDNDTAATEGDSPFWIAYREARTLPPLWVAWIEKQPPASRQYPAQYWEFLLEIEAERGWSRDLTRRIDDNFQAALDEYWGREGDDASE